MTAARAAIARRALALTGTRFVLHGRDPAHGLDCVGLVGAALAGGGQTITLPHGYALRNRTIAPWLALAAANGLEPAAGNFEPGDILLVRPGPAQHHLLVVLDQRRAVHAHAGLRRVVVETIADCVLPAAHWRLAPSKE